MNAPFHKPLRMSVDEFVVWSDLQPDRHELLDGAVLTMAPEQMGHSRVKHRVFRALEDAIRLSELPCEAIGDGMAIEIGERTFLVPDITLRCGEKLPDSATRVTDPVMVIEVLSPSNTAEQMILKFTQYLSVPTLSHYVEIDPESGRLLHYRRSGDGIMLQFGHLAEPLTLDPPGLTLQLGGP